MPKTRKRKNHNVKLAKRKANIVTKANTLRKEQAKLMEQFKTEYERQKQEKLAQEEIKN